MLETNATIKKMLLYAVFENKNEIIINTIFSQIDQVNSEIQNMIL